MPTRVPRACGHCGLTHFSGEQCSLVAARDKARKARFDQKRPNSSQRGYGRDWEDGAKSFLALPENQTCARCRKAKATVVMHIHSIRTAPHLRMVRSNWRPGCQRCNAIEAAQERHEQKGTRQ